MSTLTEATTNDDATAMSCEGPRIAHAWCTCYERDGIIPFPSLCGQATKEMTPPADSWPADMQSCVICAALVDAEVPCPRCGGGLTP